MKSRSATVIEEFFVSQLNAKYQLSIFTYLLLVVIEVARSVEVVEVVALSTLNILLLS